MKHLREIYDYRQMIFSLVRKELRGRYKGSALGFLWTFINPLLQLCVYTFVFSIVMPNNIDKFYLYLFVGYGKENLFPSGSYADCLCDK